MCNNEIQFVELQWLLEFNQNCRLNANMLKHTTFVTVQLEYFDHSVNQIYQDYSINQWVIWVSDDDPDATLALITFMLKSSITI